MWQGRSLQWLPPMPINFAQTDTPSPPLRTAFLVREQTTQLEGAQAAWMFCAGKGGARRAEDMSVFGMINKQEVKVQTWGPG